MNLEVGLTKNFLTKRSKLRPAFAIVLGSGLARLADAVASDAVVPYKDIPFFPQAGVDGHEGRLIFGTLRGTPVLVFSGRAHYYEGQPMGRVAYPAYVAQALGAKVFIATNAAGGLNEDFGPSDLMLIRDHINFMGDNPLRGLQVPKGRSPFQSMLDAYDTELFDLAMDVAKQRGITLHHGIYAAMTGPTFETEAELRMLYRLGADAVGMSTVPEVIAARHAGMRVLGISVISNDAFPLRRSRPAHVDHTAVLRAVEESCPRVQAIVEGVIEGAGH